MIDELEHQLRHELQGVLVPYDEARANEMTRVAEQAALLGTRRSWHAPAAAAAAVVLVGGGAAALAADHGTGAHGSTNPGNSPTTSASTPTTKPSAGCDRTDNIQTCLTKLGCGQLRLQAENDKGPVTVKVKPGGKVLQVIGPDHTITCGVVGK